MRTSPGTWSRCPAPTPGSGSATPGAAQQLDIHQPTFDVDERAIGVGVHVMAATALNALWDDNTRVTEPLPNAAALGPPVTPQPGVC